ncbi:MAG: hypothetical protein IPO81_18905 [Kouleothrix sp.]|nr:hypothetical protein [Kouleothrix sp.]
MIDEPTAPARSSSGSSTAARPVPRSRGGVGHVDRARPIAPYPTLIADYHRLGDSERGRAEQSLMSCLRRRSPRCCGAISPTGRIAVKVRVINSDARGAEPGLFEANPDLSALLGDAGGGRRGREGTATVGGGLLEQVRQGAAVRGEERALVGGVGAGGERASRPTPGESGGA